MKCMEEKNRGLAAEELFERGYNCAQAVAGAFADQMGMPQSQVLQLAGGFGGGVGRLREICGAVSGMAMVLSAVGISLKIVSAIQGVVTAFIIAVVAVLAWRYVKNKPTVWKVLYVVFLLVVLVGIIIPLVV